MLKRKDKNREPWQIAAARFCLENSEGFKKEDLKNFINENYNVKEKHIERFFDDEILMPPGIKFKRGHDNELKWVPPLDLVSKVTDYDELKEARKNANNAFWLALLSIIIASITLMVNILSRPNNNQALFSDDHAREQLLEQCLVDSNNNYRECNPTFGANCVEEQIERGDKCYELYGN